MIEEIIKGNAGIKSIGYGVILQKKNDSYLIHFRSINDESIDGVVDVNNIPEKEKNIIIRWMRQYVN